MVSAIIIGLVLLIPGTLIAYAGLKRSKKIDKVTADTGAAGLNIAALDVLVDALQTDRSADRSLISDLRIQVGKLETKLESVEARLETALAEIASLKAS